MQLKTFTIKIFAILLLGHLLVDQAFGQENSRRLADKSAFKIKKGTNLGASVNKRFIKKSTNKQSVKFGKHGGFNTKAPGDTVFFQPFDFTTWPADLIRLKLDNKTPGNNPGSTINTQLFGSNAWVTTSTPPDANRFGASLSWTTQGGAVNRWLVTPPINLTEGNILSWKAQASNIDFPDGYEVRICTTCAGNITAANVVSSFGNLLFTIDEEDANDVFVEREIDLSGYSNQVVRLAFRNTSVDMDRLYIDDILVYKKPQIDASAGLILSPDTSIYDCGKTNFPAVVTVLNKGISTLTNVKIKLESTGPIADSVVFILPSLEAGIEDTITFSEGLDLSAVGEYELKLSTTVDGDLITTNNESFSSFITNGPSSSALSFDFEDLSSDDGVFLPAGWVSSSEFSPLNEGGGLNGGNSLQFPVFNNLGILGSSPVNLIATNQYTNIPSGQTLSFRYKLSTTSTPEYALAPGDTIFFNVLKNCEKSRKSITITTDNQFVSSEYQKVFISTDSLGLSPSDKFSIEFIAKADPLTSNILIDIDDVTIGEVQNNDVAFSGLTRPFFSVMKRRQATPISFSGNILNEGNSTISPVRIIASVTPSGLQDTARVSNLQGGLSKSFTTTPGLNFTENGNYTIDINANTLGVTDPNPFNNVFSTIYSVTDSTMGKDFGDPFESATGITGLGYGPTAGGLRIMATSIPTTLRDTLTSVSVFIGSLTTEVTGRAFFASVNQVTGAFTIDTSTTLVTIIPDQENTWQSFRYRNRTGTPTSIRERGRAVLPNSTNLYGVRVVSGDLRVGFNLDGAVDDGSYIYFGGELTGTQDITIFGVPGPYSLFIRPNFGRPSTWLSATQIEKSLQFAEIVPNPANGQSSLSIQMNKARKLDIQLFSTDGKQINSTSAFGNAGSNRIELPISNLQKGIYLVKIVSEGFSVTKKLVVE